MFATIPAKMISERPWLRRPYSEISSPSQIANIVPAVIVTITATEAIFHPNPSRIGVPETFIAFRMPICESDCSAAIGTAM